MDDDFSELDVAANNPALLGAESEGRAAFAVDAEGEIVWAGAVAFGLIGAGSLDAATRRTLARMATARSGGMLRLRLGGAGARGTAFQARPIVHEGAPALLGLEALAPFDVPTPETVEAPEVEKSERDVAVEEGIEAQSVSGYQFDEPNGINATDQDRPPDPRRNFGALAPELNAREPGATEPVAREVDDIAYRDSEPMLPDEPALRAETVEPFRFAFEVDAATCVTLLSPELERSVGPSASAAIGRRWSDVSADLGLDPEGAVSAALARHGSWSDIEISWPTLDGRRLPLSLSALPMFDRGRSFVGFRGLGRSIGEPVWAEPRAAGTVERAATFVNAATDEQTDEPDALAVSTDLPAELAEPHAPLADAVDELEPAIVGRRDEPPILFEVTPGPVVFAGNVVALREVAPPMPGGEGLSSSEENAFDEIARRLRGLGVRVEERVEQRDEEHDLEIEFEQISIAGAYPDLAPERTAPEDQRELPFAAGADELLRLIDRLPLGALVLRGGDVAHANRTALEFLGCRELGDLTGRGADTLFAEALPQDRDAPAGVMRLIAANGGEVEVEARLSTIGWGGAPATLVTLRRPEASLGLAREIESRERELSAALDVATDGVMTLDGSGRILSVNRRGETLFGFEAREVLGSLFTLSLAPESRRAAFECLDGLKGETGQSEGSVEVLGLSRHGGALPLLMTLGRITGAGDDRFCAVLRDVGPWKRAEEELISARRQAERANTQKSEFLAKVGHEIRTPLNAIIGFAEVMMEERLGPVGSARYKDYLKDIHTSGGHLVKMVDDLLDITRIETGKLKLDFVAVDLNEIASQAAALLQPQANRDRVIIRTSLARGLPNVLADRRSVRQIMTNLAANAVKLSRPGGQVIVATALSDTGQAVFRVRDAGAGMSKQEIARAFEPFRPFAVADNDTGFGLGLPLTRALAEANQAALALMSEVGHGTLAEVTFPASRVLAV